MQFLSTTLSYVMVVLGNAVEQSEFFLTQNHLRFIDVVSLLSTICERGCFYNCNCNCVISAQCSGGIELLGNLQVTDYQATLLFAQGRCYNYNMQNRACHKSEISLKFFGTRIFSWVCIYINGKFWFWRIFFIFRWVKMPPKGYNEKNIKSLYILVPMHF